MTSDQWITFLLCCVSAAVQLYFPIIIGVPAGLPAAAIGLSVLVGGTIAVVVFLLLAPRLQPWIQRQLNKTEKRKKAVARATGLSERHGVFGVGFLAPFLIGLLLAAGVGVILNLPGRSWAST